MNRAQFMAELTRRLFMLPGSELRSSLEFYSEMIADRMDEGMSEEQAIAALGDIDSIAREALGDAAKSAPGPSEAAPADLPEEPSARAPKKKRERRGRGAGRIVALALTSPIWLSVWVGYISLIWGLLIGIVAIEGSMFVSAAACALASCVVFYMRVPSGLFLLGGALLCAGIALLLLPLTKWCIRTALRWTKWSIALIVGRGAKGGGAK